MQDLTQQNERYELELVGEQGINVKTTNFDANQSKVTMMVWSDDDEAWAPYPRDHDLWNKDINRFVQVTWSLIVTTCTHTGQVNIVLFCKISDHYQFNLLYGL